MADEEKADAPADDAAAKEDDGANAEEKADATDGGGDAASGEAEPAKAGSAAASGKPGPADFGLILTILGSFVGLYNSLTTYSYVPDDDIVLEMGKPGLVCVGAMESPFILTKLCAAMWALAQLYIAFPIMLGGEDAFNLLGLFNAFCISALPLLTGPLVKCLDALNGQICEGGVCTRVPATGDMIAVSLAWKAGQQAMAVTMRTSSTQKLNAIALTVGALGSTFVQGFFLTYISAALSSITGLDIDLTDDPIGNFTNCTQELQLNPMYNCSNTTDIDDALAPIAVTLPGGFSASGDPAKMLGYIKLSITGACAGATLAAAAALREIMMVLAGSIFGSFMFVGAVSMMVGGGQISLGGIMSGTFGVCDERGYYVQMLWFGTASLAIRAHQKKWVKNPTFQKYFKKAFKPAFDMNNKLEDIANGIIPPEKEIKMGPDGLPVDRIERWKFKAKNFKEDTKAKAKAKVDEAKAKAKAKALEAKDKGKAQLIKAKSAVLAKLNPKAAAAAAAKAKEEAEAKAKEAGEGGDGETKEGDGDGEKEKKPAGPSAGAQAAKVVVAVIGGLVALIGAVVMGLLAVAKGAAAMIQSAIAECIFPTLAMCGIKPPGGGGGGPLVLPDPPPCPEELKDVSHEDLASKLESAGFAEMKAAVIEKEITGDVLWIALWNEINNPTAIVLTPEQVAKLMANKDFLLKCLNRVEKSYLYSGFNTWRGKILMAKMMADMAESDEDEEE